MPRRQHHHGQVGHGTQFTEKRLFSIRFSCPQMRTKWKILVLSRGQMPGRIDTRPGSVDKCYHEHYFTSMETILAMFYIRKVMCPQIADGVFISQNAFIDHTQIIKIKIHNYVLLPNKSCISEINTMHCVTFNTSNDTWRTFAIAPHTSSFAFALPLLIFGFTFDDS